MHHSRPLASVSLDLDNKWSYLKTHGDAAWQSLPSYLPLVVPRVLEFLAERKLPITFFIVGQDAAQPADAPVLAEIPRAGHEVGNHSFHHEPWLHLYRRDQLEAELARAEDAIAAATGARPRGFRGPGFSVSRNTLEVLHQRGYRYDASTFPTFLGPLARAYYFFSSRLTREERRQRARLFGTWREGLRRLKPYQWSLDRAALLEIPVTTFPLLRSPIHASYLLYLGGYSTAAALAYWRCALAACRAGGVEPSLLLHPLDFLGADDDADLAFFPAMNQPAERKLELMSDILAELTRWFEPVPMGRHADAILARGGLPRRRPRFGDESTVEPPPAASPPAALAGHGSTTAAAPPNELAAASFESQR